MLLCACAVTANAQDYGEALPFLRISRDPAALTGGAAQTSPGAYAAFYNPSAGVFMERGGQAAFSYGNWVAGSSDLLGFGGVMRLGERIALNAGFSADLGEAYDVYNKLGKVTRSFTPKDMTAAFGIGYRLNRSFSVGANVKYASSSLADEVSYGSVAADIFVTGRFGGLSASAGVANIGGKVESSSGDSYSLPSSVSAGLGYGLFLTDRLKADASLTADCYFSGAVAAGLGASVSWSRFVTFRAGYNYGGESVIPSYATAGLGFSFAAFALDATYYIVPSDSPLSGTFLLALRYNL